MSDNLPAVALVRAVGWEEPSVGDGGFVVPSGTVTLLLGDVEGSTRAWEADPMSTEAAIVELNDLVDELIGRFDGVRPVEQGEGDSFVAAFGRARDGVACAVVLQQALAGGRLRMRLGVHTGDVVRRDEGNYVGPAIIRTARLRDLAHGGQTLVSEATRQLVADALPDGATFRDLGPHRLRDLSRPERVFQLCHPDLGDEFPPLRSLDARPHNLPMQRTTFVGRTAEMNELTGLSGVERLVTLTGSGGCGKTRLALQVGAELLDSFTDGVWLVDLAPIADPAAVAVTAAQVFALKEAPGMSPADMLVAYLGGRRVLLIVDNCEHVLDEAAGLVDAVLAGCQTVSVLATSRQPLGLAGEVTWRVPSLPFPEERGPAGIAGVSASDAVALFADRARRSRAGFAVTERNAEAVAEICRRLDGIPLALELAAARVRVFTPAQIAARLSERFALLTGSARTALARQQTLEASVDWSYALLTDVEQVVFRRLAVFAGGFAIDAAEDVCAGPGVQAHQVVDVLSLLVDKSLVVVDDDDEDARYRLLETIRAYAMLRLAASGEELHTRDRHRGHYLTLAEAGEVGLEGAEQPAWLTRIMLEYPNLRGALSHCRHRGDCAGLARLAAALTGFWFSRGPLAEGQGWLDLALGHQLDDPALRARVLWGRGWLASGDFDVATMTRCQAEGVAIAREIGDDRLAARFLALEGDVNLLVGGPLAPLEEAEAMARRTGDALALVWALGAHMAAAAMRDPSRARPYGEEAVSAAKAAGAPTLEASACSQFAGVLYFGGELSEAMAMLDQALDAAGRVADRWHSGPALIWRAHVQKELDDRSALAATLDRVEVVERDTGVTLYDPYVRALRGYLALREGNPGRAGGLVLEAASMPGAPVQQAQALIWAAEVELLAGRHDQAGAHAAQVVDVGRAGFGFYLSSGLLLQGRLARIGQQPLAAAGLAHEALDVADRVKARCRVIDALELLGGISGDVDSPAEAARLLGAARTEREATGYGSGMTETEADMARLRAAMGGAAFERAYADGRSLALDDAVAYAQRGRGKRGRPASGWDSLTPTEQQVVELLREGCGNAEIGKRLFVSSRTVQAHLTRIYTKLGVTSRAKLAAEAAARAR